MSSVTVLSPRADSVPAPTESQLAFCKRYLDKLVSFLQYQYNKYGATPTADTQKIHETIVKTSYLRVLMNDLSNAYTDFEPDHFAVAEPMSELIKLTSVWVDQTTYRDKIAMVDIIAINFQVNEMIENYFVQIYLHQPSAFEVGMQSIVDWFRKILRK